ncbi:MAG: hypothetical protein D6679_11510 [Candidatus Hydrogenedentota bacterium]|nr:MAG: hypothetical protein D6679_11510 [Candidatus Hydrogenedentota bacterium]
MPEEKGTGTERRSILEIHGFARKTGCVDGKLLVELGYDKRVSPGTQAGRRARARSSPSKTGSWGTRFGCPDRVFVRIPFLGGRARSGGKRQFLLDTGPGLKLAFRRKID